VLVIDAHVNLLEIAYDFSLERASDPFGRDVQDHSGLGRVGPGPGRAWNRAGLRRDRPKPWPGRGEGRAGTGRRGAVQTKKLPYEGSVTSL